MTDVFGVSLEVETSGMQNGDAALDKLAMSGDKVDKSLTKVDRSVDELNKDLAKTKPIADSATKSIIGMDSAATKTAKGFHLQKGASQQLGYQLQDMAVQAQMGISPFTILGQQGSQLAMVLGPQGALIGAVIAIGAAMGGVLWKSMGKVSASSKEIRERIDAVTKSFEDLDKAQKLFYSREISNDVKSKVKEMNAISAEMDSLNQKIKEQRTLIRSYKESLASDTFTLTPYVDKIIKAEEKIISLREKIETLNASFSTGMSEIAVETKKINDINANGEWLKDNIEKGLVLGEIESKKLADMRAGLRLRRAELALIQEIADTSNHLLTIEMSSKDAAIAKGRAQETVLKNQRMSAAESAISSAITSGKTTLELENERYQESLKLVREYADEKRWGDDKRRETEILLETEHQAKLLELEKKGAKDRTSSSMNMFEAIDMGVSIYNNIQDAADAKQMAQLERDLANKENFSAAEIALKEKTAKALFEKQKKGDLASIKSSTSVAMMTQAAQGNWGGVALALSLGMAQHAAASAAEYGGGGSTPSGSGATGAPSSVQNNNNNSGGNIVNITLNNANSGTTDLEALKEFFQADGVLFDINTAQGELLR